MILVETAVRMAETVTITIYNPQSCTYNYNYNYNLVVEQHKDNQVLFVLAYS